MNREEEQRILSLLESVEKEQNREEVRGENVGTIRRELFIDESPIEPIDEPNSDDDIEDNVEVSSEENVDQQENSDSEQSGDEENEFQIRPEYIGRNNTTKWNIHCPPRNRRTAAENIVTHLPGVKFQTQDCTPIKAWRLFFTDEILDDIVNFTNQRIRKVRPNYTRERDARDTSRNELEAFIGLLYMAGVLRASHLNLFDLWATDGTGVEFFRNSMNLKRFKFLIRVIRFDDARTRRQRRTFDRLAPIRSVFERVVEQCKSNFSISEFCTIDEMLEAFRGRCAFRQYIKNKPAKYGIKVFSLACAKTFYTANMEIYAGRQPEGPFRVENSGLAVVDRLVQPVSGSGRNITTDNWYTSIPLADHLLQTHKLTLVGTLRKNKPEIPPQFLAARERPLNSSMFAFKDKKTLVSYCSKKNKVVLLLSTMHHTDDIDPESGDQAKPFVLTFYNSTKGGVDVVDQYKERYSVSRTSNRWPLTLFFTLLNVVGINSYIVNKHNTQEFGLQRRSFLKDLSKQLCRNYLSERNDQPKLPKQIKRNIRQMLGLEEEVQNLPRQDDGPGRCYYCDTRKNRKTKTKCSSCHNFICKEHTNVSCVKCSTADTSESEED